MITRLTNLSNISGSSSFENVIFNIVITVQPVIRPSDCDAVISETIVIRFI